jgi:WXG100 family type VII secretion target
MKVTPEALIAQSGNCAKTAAEQHGQGQSLLAQIQGMLSSDWVDSQAATQFNALSEQWQQASMKVSESLQGISVLLTKSANAYADLDAQLASAIRPS